MFGGFYSVPVTEQIQELFDSNIFVFSFESHGRCMTPQMFAVKEVLKEKACVEFEKDYRHGLSVWSVL